MRPDSETPFFFGADGGLFGMFHAPALPARRAMLMCPPLGQDLIRCHRVYRQLAQALAAQGVAVLRFDYHGTGDSAGASVEVDWDRCVADTVLAAAELRTRGGVDRVVAFGARLGGSIALAAAGQARFAEVIAWDPVLDGGDYVAALDAMQVALRQDGERFNAPRSHADVAAQWLGFDVGDGLRRQLAALRVDATEAPTLVLDSMPASSGARWERIVTARGRVATIAPPTPWNDLRRLEAAILSPPLIQAVTGRLKEIA
ncbi:Alpha/beta hydrolase family protein [Luteibacter sp. UNC138MFCol5.1]|uniref:alpha/beta fold hydrolase n=1 Tax=Luteibacter sp. UNC138MFCol5.1 TaxID=1502774 RepID=UPI0008AFB415|nr:alpha/beta fold hydrolase [Luteibacter sp. UNC138MFCol5.1]SEP14293.1 Alpha/beta hydrolase family protein [Luteibacter sp. UNC138MFCol5.1]